MRRFNSQVKENLLTIQKKKEKEKLFTHTINHIYGNGQTLKKKSVLKIQRRKANI